MPTSADPNTETWPKAMATVLECRYEMRAARALAFGAPSGKHFRIRYNYFANGETHEGQLYSATAIPQNTLFPVRYNPAAAHDHTHDHTAAPPMPNPRRAMLVIGVLGSLVLSLAWLLLMRSCS